MVLKTPFGLLGTSLHAGVATVQLILLVVAVNQGRREVWLFCLGSIAVLAFIAWVAAVRRRHAITGTPTSRIATAAQGYVELQGVGMPLDINPLHSPVSGAACLWYCYQVERKTGDDKWEMLEQARSHTSFVLDDGSGVCMVDPEGAEILTRHRKSWNDGDYRYVEWTLRGRDRIYVLGNFVTRHASQGLDASADQRDLLAEWKQDQAGLLRRFDLDHDGQIDQREWALARRLARGEIAKRHRELQQQPDLHLVHDAASRLYLISNHEPEKLARRFLWLAGFQLVCFFLALGFFGGWWQRVGGA
jgi:hypothetical protein